jgi:hypothetical protein
LPLLARAYLDSEEDTVTPKKQSKPAPRKAEALQEVAVSERELADVDRELIATAEEAQSDRTNASAADETQLTLDPLATAWTELDLRCPTCSIIHYVPICTFLNAQESPGLVQRLIAGHFNLKRCPICHKVEFVDYPFTYYDPAGKLAVQVRAEWEWHAGGGEEWYAARLEDFFERWAEYDVHIDVVFGPDQLVQRFLQPARVESRE